MGNTAHENRPAVQDREQAPDTGEGPTPQPELRR